MKRLFFGLLVAGIAFGGSAFTNVDLKSNFHHGKQAGVTQGFLVQTAAGVWRLTNTAPGSCTTLADDPCKYQVNSPGSNSIPVQTTYSASDIASFISQVTPTSDADAIYTGTLN